MYPSSTRTFVIWKHTRAFIQGPHNFLMNCELCPSERQNLPEPAACTAEICCLLLTRPGGTSVWRPGVPAPVPLPAVTAWLGVRGPAGGRGLCVPARCASRHQKGTEGASVHLGPARQCPRENVRDRGGDPRWDRKPPRVRGSWSTFYSDPNYRLFGSNIK